MFKRKNKQVDKIKELEKHLLTLRLSIEYCTNQLNKLDEQDITLKQIDKQRELLSKSLERLNKNYTSAENELFTLKENKL